MTTTELAPKPNNNEANEDQDHGETEQDPTRNESVPNDKNSDVGPQNERLVENTDKEHDGSNEQIVVDSSNEESSKTETDPQPIRRPTKRARSAYFIFADEMRPTIQKEHPGEGVGAQAKRLGAKWQNIAPEEKERFQQLAAAEKQKVAAELEAFRAKYGDIALEDDGNPSSSASLEDDLIFPVARIRKIAKLDPEVKTLSKEALQLVVKSAELALSKLGKECVKVARIQNRRTLLPDDVAHVCTHREVFSFLKDDIQDLTKALAQHKELVGGGKENNQLNKKEAARKEAAAGSKPLTSYFVQKK